MHDIIDFMLNRRSSLSRDIGGPGPDDGELATILKIASRVPDHGKLNPWRFIVIRGDARLDFGKILGRVYEVAVKSPDADKRRAEEQRFAKAPVIVAVVAKNIIHIKIPHWEQILSAGAVCQNLLLAANALGYSAQWTSDWLAYDKQVLKALGLEDGEQIAGYIYLGMAAQKLEDRPRPPLDEIVSYWDGDEV